MYTNNGKSEREIKESIPFTIATKRIEYLGLSLLKEKNYLANKGPSSQGYGVSNSHVWM